MAQRMNVMPAERRDEIHCLVMSSYLASMEDGPRSFASIVRSVRGVVPQCVPESWRPRRLAVALSGRAALYVLISSTRADCREPVHIPDGDRQARWS
jgi:hypothetical protein